MSNGKLHAMLSARMEAGPAEEKYPIIVKYKERRTGLVRASGRLAGLEVRRVYRLVHASALEATSQGIMALEQHEDVERVWLDLPVHICLNDSVPIIRAPQVWDAGFKGAGVKVAIVDTGIDPDHPDFAGRILTTQDFTGEGARDNHGHGSHVAGIVAGAGTASEGTYRGVAPEASIMAAKVLRGDGSGMMSDVMAGVEWAVDQGARVINLSLGSSGPCDGTDALSATVDAAVGEGVVVCVAAGNDGPGASTVGSPGCARRVITIGASVSAPGAVDSIADFSSRGPTSDGRVKPDLAFPGVDIVSCRAQGTSMGTPVDERYTRASGTSMATPHATGVVALLLQAFPDLTPEDVKVRLMRAARSLGLEPNTQGRGRGDAYNTYLNQAGEPLPGEPPPSPPPPSPGPGCPLVFLALLRMLMARS